MKRSVLDTITAGLFEYAGTFPPASLSFEEALQTSATFKQTLHRPALVGADCVLAEKDLLKLDDLTLMNSGFRSGDPFRVVVLGDAENLSRTSMIKIFLDAHRKSSIPKVVRSYETLLPIEAYGHEERCISFLSRLSDYLGDPNLRIAIELDGSTAHFHEVALTLGSAITSSVHRSKQRIAIKVRGSGPKKITILNLSHALGLVSELGLDFKATAGLHHPILEPHRYGNDLGFLNLIAALYLRRSLGSRVFHDDALIACLTSSATSDFTLSDGLRWRDYSISEESVSEAKIAHFFSIGSCSIHEPDEDLARLFP